MPIAITPIASIPSFFEPNDAASLSADGRYLAFTTERYQIQIRDMHTGVVTPVAAPPGMKYQSNPVFSADGSTLAFRASVGGGAILQAYVLNLQSGQLHLASSDANGVAGNLGASNNLSLSTDGRYLVFMSDASNLVAGDTNARSDVFRKDLATGEIRLASSTSQGAIGNDLSIDGRISADGQSVVFTSRASNLLGVKSDLHVYVKNMVTGTVRFADADASGNLKSVSNLGANPLISADGSKVAFQHYDGSIYVKDMQSGALVNVALTASGNTVPGTLSVQALSPDGRYVTFSSYTGNALNVYQKDVQSGVLTTVSPKTLLGGKGDETAIAASADGQTVVVASTTLGFGSIALPAVSSSSTSLFAIKLNGVAYNGANEAYVATVSNSQLAGGNGNDSYMVNDSSTMVLETAGGGTDTVKSYLANYTLPANVENLLLGDTVSGTLGMRNPNGTGNELNNRITGNDQSNILRGMDGDDILDGGAGKLPYGPGNDTIDGGIGADIVVYQTDYASSTITKTADGYTVARNWPYSGVDLLQNIERIEFAGKALSLPGDTHAAQAYRIYQAAFNRAPDSSGLGFWVKQIDNGASVTEVAQGFMQSAEFKSLYGERPTNADMVTKFYQNVLHRAPDAGGFAFWTDVLNSGRGTGEYVLAQFAESPENVAALTGVTSVGFTFTVFA